MHAELRGRVIHEPRLARGPLLRSDWCVDGVEARSHEVTDPGDTTVAFVMVHGIGVSSQFFATLASAVKPHGRVVLVDLPGFGGLERPDHRLGIGDFAEVVEAVLAEISLPEHVVLVGHSMGTQVVTEMLTRSPGRYSAAMLMAPVVSHAESSLGRLLLRFLLSVLREHPVQAMVVLASFARCGVGWFREVLPSLLRYPISDRIAGLSDPLLILGGDRDRVSTEAFRSHLADEAERASVVTLPKTAHGIVRGNEDRLVELLVELAAESR